MRNARAFLLSFGVLFAFAAAPSSVLTGAEDGFRTIFNGEKLTGWDGNDKFWTVEEGAITGQTTKENPTNGNTFIIWREGELDDFVLRLDYRIIGGNSGIQYRSVENVEKWGKWVIGGYQGDFEAGNRYSVRRRSSCRWRQRISASPLELLNSSSMDSKRDRQASICSSIFFDSARANSSALLSLGFLKSNSSFHFI